MNEEHKARIRAALARRRKEPTVINWDQAITNLKTMLNNLERRQQQ